MRNQGLQADWTQFSEHSPPLSRSPSPSPSLSLPLSLSLSLSLTPSLPLSISNTPPLKLDWRSGRGGDGGCGCFGAAKCGSGGI
ncbi:MAG: hypothetical protein OHK0037_26470 [Elainellaceae cyanobacterium]